MSLPFRFDQPKLDNIGAIRLLAVYLGHHFLPLCVLRQYLSLSHNEEATDQVSAEGLTRSTSSILSEMKWEDSVAVPRLPRC